MNGPSCAPVLVVGATGALGRALVRALATRGCRVRALVREHAEVEGAAEHVRGDLADAGSLRAACAGVGGVCSAAGASLAPVLRPGSPAYEDVDRDGHRRLFAIAREAGVRRAGYASVHHGPSARALAYVRAHADVEEDLAASGFAAAVVRPTGLFPAFEAFLGFARLGVAPLIGDGVARTNPVHPADAAEAWADAYVALGDTPGVRVMEAGGPDVLTRREIAALAFEAVGKRPRFVRVPPGAVRFNAGVIRPFDRRLSDLLRFFAHVNTTDALAPAVGTRRLADAFAEGV